jgi:hypothetical protein
MGLIRILLDDYINELKNKKVIKCFGESLGKTNQRITEDKANYEIYREQTENKDMIEEIKSKDNKKEEDAFFNSMEEYDKSGKLDKDIEIKVQNEEFDHLFSQAVTFGQKYRMRCEEKNGNIYITTDAGKWYFKPKTSGKVTLYHKNYEFRMNQAEYYHKQFTVEWSVREILEYINRHDRKKLLREKRKKQRNEN